MQEQWIFLTRIGFLKPPREVVYRRLLKRYQSVHHLRLRVGMFQILAISCTQAQPLISKITSFAPSSAFLSYKHNWVKTFHFFLFSSLVCTRSCLPLYYEGKQKETIFPETSCTY